jgi:hypothetical protein
MAFLAGPLRPLELTKEEWFTEEIVQLNFEVANDMLINTGVAIPN